MPRARRPTTQPSTCAAACGTAGATPATRGVAGCAHRGLHKGCSLQCKHRVAGCVRAMMWYVRGTLHTSRSATSDCSSSAMVPRKHASRAAAVVCGALVHWCIGALIVHWCIEYTACIGHIDMQTRRCRRLPMHSMHRSLTNACGALVHWYIACIGALVRWRCIGALRVLRALRAWCSACCSLCCAAAVTYQLRSMH